MLRQSFSLSSRRLEATTATTSVKTKTASSYPHLTSRIPCRPPFHNLNRERVAQFAWIQHGTQSACATIFPSFLLSSDISSDKSMLRGTPTRIKHIKKGRAFLLHILQVENVPYYGLPLRHRSLFPSAATPVSTLSQGDLQL
jgi:hypothetical protein